MVEARRAWGRIAGGRQEGGGIGRAEAEGGAWEGDVEHAGWSGESGDAGGLEGGEFVEGPVEAAFDGALVAFDDVLDAVVVEVGDAAEGRPARAMPQQWYRMEEWLRERWRAWRRAGVGV